MHECHENMKNFTLDDGFVIIFAKNENIYTVKQLIKTLKDKFTGYVKDLSFGNFFKGKYGDLFNETSVCLSVKNINNKALLTTAEQTKQKVLIVRDFKKNETYIIKT